MASAFFTNISSLASSVRRIDVSKAYKATTIDFAAKIGCLFRQVISASLCAGKSWSRTEWCRSQCLWPFLVVAGIAFTAFPAHATTYYYNSGPIPLEGTNAQCPQTSSFIGSFTIPDEFTGSMTVPDYDVSDWMFTVSDGETYTPANSIFGVRR
jgi:hypothetical protein